MSHLVVVTDATFPDVDAEEAAARAQGAEFRRHACRTDDEVVRAVTGARVAVVQFAPFSARAVAALAPGATVIRYGVGYNNLDTEAMRAAGVSGAYVPDYCTDEVADHTAAMILTRLRRLPAFDASVRAGEWKAVGVARPMPAFRDTTIGFFGFGRIAQSVASRMAPFGFRLIACDPFLPASGHASPAVEAVGFEELLARADCISLHAPATKDTVGAFGIAAFRAMKTTAILVNSARGDLVVEADLAEALVSGLIGGAALDVFIEEPLPGTSPLRSAPNLSLSPHAAWYSEVAVTELQRLVADEIARALRGDPIRRPIPGFERNAAR
jgi:D-3-phosphoglycerate dehydrogenase / 2-oxoglutarate reductase